MKQNYVSGRSMTFAFRWLFLLMLLSSHIAWAQPTLVKDINPGGGASEISSTVNVNGTLFFAATNGTQGKELWKSDGTAAGTVLVKDINPGAGSADVANLTIMNGKLYFTANNGSTGAELWETDGMTAGTVMVKDLNPGTASGAPSSLTDANGALLFCS